MMLAESQKKTRMNPVLFLLRFDMYLNLVANEALAHGKPNNDADHNDNGEDDELHFHVLEPHLPPELFALPLKVVSLETKILGLVNKKLDLLTTIKDLLDVVHHNSLDFSNLRLDFRYLVHFIWVVSTILHVILQLGSEFLV
jgi:hypothetical protein